MCPRTPRPPQCQDLEACGERRSGPDRRLRRDRRRITGFGRRTAGVQDRRAGADRRTGPRRGQGLGATAGMLRDLGY